MKYEIVEGYKTSRVVLVISSKIKVIPVQRITNAPLLRVTSNNFVFVQLHSLWDGRGIGGHVLAICSVPVVLYCGPDRMQRDLASAHRHLQSPLQTVSHARIPRAVPTFEATGCPRNGDARPRPEAQSNRARTSPRQPPAVLLETYGAVATHGRLQLALHRADFS